MVGKVGTSGTVPDLSRIRPCWTAGCSFAVPPHAWRPGLVTHIERQPVDVDLAMRQWQTYVAALETAGWEIIHVPPMDECPDGVFIEDDVVMYGDRAVVARPGADERKPETAAIADLLGVLGYDVVSIEAPGTLDGGDVLKHDGTVWVGIGGRTNQSGIDQLTAYLEPYGARVVPVPVTQGAAPEVGRHRPS